MYSNAVNPFSAPCSCPLTAVWDHFQVYQEFGDFQGVTAVVGGFYASTIDLPITLLCLASHVHNTQRTDYCRCFKESLKKKATNNKSAYNNMQACATCAGRTPTTRTQHIRAKRGTYPPKGRDNIRPHEKMHPLLMMGEKKREDRQEKKKSNVNNIHMQVRRAKTVGYISNSGQWGKSQSKGVERKQTGPTHRGNGHTFRRGPPENNHPALVRSQGKPTVLRRPRQLNRVTSHLTAQELSGKPSRSRRGYGNSQRHTQKERNTD